jgi:CheY-like chemotaxis protein
VPIAVEGALDALRLLAQANGQRIQAVVCDRRMPVMDGIQLLREVQRLYPRIARIMLTGSGHLRDHAIAQRVLRKPCAPSVLVAMLDRAVAENDAAP